MVVVDQEKMDYLNELSKKIVNCIYNVHKELGPGLLERAYQMSLCRELELCNLAYESEVMIPLIYKGLNIESGYRLDVIVEDEIIIELKAVDEIKPVFGSQLLTYLRLSNKKLGLLVNFNVSNIGNGIKRVIN
jgi:GxxExxY protein